MYGSFSQDASCSLRSKVYETGTNTCLLRLWCQGESGSMVLITNIPSYRQFQLQRMRSLYLWRTAHQNQKRTNLCCTWRITWSSLSSNLALLWTLCSLFSCWGHQRFVIPGCISWNSNRRYFFLFSPIVGAIRRNRQAGNRASAGTYPSCQRRLRVYCFAVRQDARKRDAPTFLPIIRSLLN